MSVARNDPTGRGNSSKGTAAPVTFSLILFLLAFAALLALGTVSAETNFEDFEDESEGAKPSGDFYTYSEEGAGTSSSEVTTTDAINGQSFRHTSTSGVLDPIFTWSSPTQYTEHSFTFNCIPGAVTFRNSLSEEGPNGIIWELVVTRASATECSFTSIGTSFSGDACASTGQTLVTTDDLEFVVTVDYDLQSVHFDANGGTVTADLDFCTANAYSEKFRFKRDGGNNMGMVFDDWSATGDVLLVPETPTGLSSIVLDASVGAVAGEILLNFPVSSDDPEPVSGEYLYRIYVNGFQVGTDPLGPEDNAGEREATLSVSGSSAIVIQVRAENATTGLQSGLSCAVAVNPSIQFDADHCGTQPAPGGFSAGLPGISPTVAYILGLILTAAVAGFGFWVGGKIGGAIGLAAGFGGAIILGLWTPWLLILAVLLIAAAIVWGRRGG